MPINVSYTLLQTINRHIVNNKGLRRAQHDMTAASLQGLPIVPV